MLTSSLETQKLKTQKKIRYLEYYDMQSITDTLYSKSKNGFIFTNLIDLITNEENIRLAYRNIKSNTGSLTPGVDGRTIRNIEKLELSKFINLVRKQFKFYKARPVRRVEIPKPNGKTRPLGIPTILDRIVQQCILQILEPICEAKFYEFSYGFRPNRSTGNAIAMCNKHMQLSHLQYVIDVDIKGFFDNVNHSKLIKQMWTLGIRDKKLICIIKEMLKAPIVLPNREIEYPTKGTPQGGILSPLLSLIVLNELDWWIASQWDCFPTKHQYHSSINKNGIRTRGNEIRALRKSNLKEMYIVRYADDFKIFCRDFKTARKVFIATKSWLSERLKLDISDEKSKIVNLLHEYSSFLGFELKLTPRRKGYVIKSHVSTKAVSKIKDKLRNQINVIGHLEDSKEVVLEIKKYNSIVVGIHEYYKYATCACSDFRKISFDINKQLYNRLRDMTKEGTIEDAFIKKAYGRSQAIRFLHGYPIVPVSFIKPTFPMGKNRRTNKYTTEGRIKLYENLKLDIELFHWFMRNPPKNSSIKLSDNLLSVFSGQMGKCAITGQPLVKDEMNVYLKENNCNEAYSNILIISNIGLMLITSNDTNQISSSIKEYKLNKERISKINVYRQLNNLSLV